MEEVKESHNFLASAAAAVEGRVQETCDDACCICLEAFCGSYPSKVTSCEHEFHLQCILEWCRRRSQCPICWQHVKLMDPVSQELLDAVEDEKDFIVSPQRNTRIFHHPTLGNFEIQHLPLPGSEADLEFEERIIQHLDAAASLGRAHDIAWREGQSRSENDRPQLLVFAPLPNAGPATSDLPTQRGEYEPVTLVAVAAITYLGEEGESAQPASDLSSTLGGGSSSSALESSVLATQEQTSGNNCSLVYIGSEVRRDADSSISTVPNVMGLHETRDNTSATIASVSSALEHAQLSDFGGEHITEAVGNHALNEKAKTPSASSPSN